MPPSVFQSCQPVTFERSEVKPPRNHNVNIGPFEYGPPWGDSIPAAMDGRYRQRTANTEGRLCRVLSMTAINQHNYQLNGHSTFQDTPGCSPPTNSLRMPRQGELRSRSVVSYDRNLQRSISSPRAKRATAERS